MYPAKGFPGGVNGKESFNAGHARDAGLICGWGRSPGGGNGNPPQYSCLGNPMYRGAYGLIKGWTQLKDWAHVPYNVHPMLGRDKISPAATEEPRLGQRGCLLAQGLPALLLRGFTWTHVTLSSPPFPTLPQKEGEHRPEGNLLGQIGQTP